MSAIKICGLTRIEDIQVVNESKPDFIGFVFAKSKRQITVQKAEILKNMLSDDIKAVGVFVNEEIENIFSIVQKNIIDMVQLHGQESEEYIKSLQKVISVPIIKAISVTSEQFIQNTIADYILLDSGAGGSGKVFDWSLIKDIKKPFFIAGGITAENVKEALQKNPFAIDVSSGVETDGIKDKNKIIEIVKLVRENK